MKNKIRVLMLDDNENIVNAVKEHFSSHAVIDIVLTCHDGKKGYDMILEKEKEYDVIVMDLIMPNKDGLSILEDLHSLKINKKIIVLTSYSKDETIRKVSDYGVSYYMLKPFDINSLEKRILDTAENKNAEKSVNVISSLISSDFVKKRGLEIKVVQDIQEIL